MHFAFVKNPSAAEHGKEPTEYMESFGCSVKTTHAKKKQPIKTLKMLQW